MRGSFWLWPLVALYCGIIFYLSSLSHPLPLLTAHVWDKALHTIEYAGLGLLLALWFGAPWQSDPGPYAWAWAIGTLYGASDEFHQRFVPGRSGELPDLLADAVGCLVGVGLVFLWSRWTPAHLGRLPNSSARTKG